MAVYQLPSGKWRAQIQQDGRNTSLGSFRTKREARNACYEGRKRQERQGPTTTLKDFWERWTTDPLFERPKARTQRIYRQQTEGFVKRFGHKPINQIGDSEVAEWFAGGAQNYTVGALRAMFNDASKPIAGRLVRVNPFSSLGITKGPGRKNLTPPPEATVWSLIAHAKTILPSFGAWLQVAAFTGMRPGELDALRWSSVDFGASRISVLEQYDSKNGVFTLPKNGLIRHALLTPQARDALIALPREAEFCFVNTKRQRYHESMRNRHWNKVRKAVGYDGPPYLATRHFFGWYATNVLLLPSEDVAIAMGHTDGGALVRQLYGHRDHGMALDRVAQAFATTTHETTHGTANVQPIRAA